MTPLTRKVHETIKKHEAKTPLRQRRAVLAALGYPALTQDEDLGVVVREAVHEVDRRVALTRIAGERRMHKRWSRVGPHGAAYRRVMGVVRVRSSRHSPNPWAEQSGPVREFCYHATKGWRNWRVAASQ